MLHSASTLFCIDLVKSKYKPEMSDERLTRLGKVAGTILALIGMLIAPLFLYASSGLFEVIQNFGGLFYVPIFCILIAGYISKKVSIGSAKLVVFLHLVFYTLLVFVLDTSLHYMHVMGLLFLIELVMMWIIGQLRPNGNLRTASRSVNPVNVDLTPWKYAKSVGLIVISMMIYTFVFFSPIGIASKNPFGTPFIVVSLSLVVLVVGAVFFLNRDPEGTVEKSKSPRITDTAS